jgi:hypothetical protein
VHHCIPRRHGDLDDMNKAEHTYAIAEGPPSFREQARAVSSLHLPLRPEEEMHFQLGYMRVSLAPQMTSPGQVLE